MEDSGVLGIGHRNAKSVYECDYHLFWPKSLGDPKQTDYTKEKNGFY